MKWANSLDYIAWYNGVMIAWRLYIDESGDHTYKRLNDISYRYLGITGVLIQKARYENVIRPGLEALKQGIFRYDSDNPPILVRSLIRGRKQWFYVLQDKALNTRWEQELLAFVSSLTSYARAFTVVIDKKAHKEKYPSQTFDPYVYGLHVLLNRVRGFLNLKVSQADVIAESRGQVEDKQVQDAYVALLTTGTNVKKYGEAADYQLVFPHPELMIRKKYQNVAGLQIADLLAHDQKLLTIQQNGSPMPTQISNFGQQINQAADKMVHSKHGRVFVV